MKARKVTRAGVMDLAVGAALSSARRADDPIAAYRSHLEYLGVLVGGAGAGKVDLADRVGLYYLRSAYLNLCGDDAGTNDARAFLEYRIRQLRGLR